MSFKRDLKLSWKHKIEVGQFAQQWAVVDVSVVIVFAVAVVAGVDVVTSVTRLNEISPTGRFLRPWAIFFPAKCLVILR